MNFQGLRLIPKTHHNDFEWIKWVTKAIGTENWLNYLNFDDGLWKATDGHRIHFYEPESEYKVGNYEIIKKARNELILEKIENKNFPDWNSILNSHTPRIFDEPDLVMESYNSIDIILAKIIRLIPDAHAIDHKFVLDLISVPYGEIQITYYGNQITCFIADKAAAVIMLLRN